MERNDHFLLSKKVTLDYYKRWIVKIILSLTLGVIAFSRKENYYKNDFMTQVSCCSRL